MWLNRKNAGVAGAGAAMALLAAGMVAVLALAGVIASPPDSAIGALTDINGTADGAGIPAAAPAIAEITGASPSDMYIDLAPGYGMGRIPKHIAYASQPNISDIVVYTAYFTVPERPAYNEYIKHTIFLWCGLQQGELGLIQPVLEWDHDDTGKYWTIACWAVNKRDNTYEVSQRLPAYPGDRIRADLRYVTDYEHPGKKVWYIAIADLTRQSMVYMLDYAGAVDTNQNLTVFSGVLEGTDLARYDADLPGDVAFEDVICKAEGGYDVPLNLTDYVHPDMHQVSIEHGNGPSESPVTIHTHDTVE